MRRCFCRYAFLLCVLGALAGCGTRETREALAKSGGLAARQQYDDANTVLIEALRAREARVRAASEPPADAASIDALTKKVQGDGEILKLERAQIPLYLHLDRADLAAAVYSDIAAGHPGDSILFRQMKNPDAKLRTCAARTLGLIGTPGAVEALIADATDLDQGARSEVISALGSIEPAKAVPVFIRALNDTYWLVRSEAADALGRSKDPAAIKPLLDAVSDPDENVAGSADNALVTLCQVPGISRDAFAPHLDDANTKVVAISAVCLAVMKDARAIPVLIKLAAAPDVPTRLLAVRGLGESGDPAAIPALRQTLHDPAVNVRGWSIIGLDNLKDGGSIPALQALAADPAQTPRIHEFAAAAAKHLAGLTDAITPAPPPVGP